MSRGNRAVSLFCGSCIFGGSLHVPVPLVIMASLWLTFVLVGLCDDV